MGNCYPLVNKKPSEASSSNFSLQLICNIWNKESHGLYDYESKNSNKIAIKVQNPGGLLKNKKTIFYHKDEASAKLSAEEPNNKVLFHITNTSSGYFLDSKTFQPSSKDQQGLDDNSIWQVIRSSKESQLQNAAMGYKLCIGDFIKLGRVRFRVKSFKGNSENNALCPFKDMKEEILTQGDGLDEFVALHNKKKDSLEMGSNNNNNSNKEANSSQNNLNLACRVCLEKTDTEDDPLLTPCKCAGTMKFIHLLCLQKWLRGRTVIKQNPVSTTIIYKSLSCELCKTVFPEFLIGAGGKKYPTLEVQLPTNNYIVLEILNRETNIPKGLHIVDMKTKQNIRIGRAHDSDLRFADISVSRTHAIIHFSNGNFYLEDNNSKFGTLVLLRQPVQLKRINPKSFTIQIESTIISFQNIMFAKSGSSCCGFKFNNNETNENNMEGLKTREIITLPDHVDHVNNPNPDVIDLNSHDFAVQLDNHMNNNSIVLNDEINGNQNQANNNVMPNANVPLIFADDRIPNMENEQQVAVNPGIENNYEFEFDSDNEYSVDFREGTHNMPIQNLSD